MSHVATRGGKKELFLVVFLYVFLFHPLKCPLRFWENIFASAALYMWYFWMGSDRKFDSERVPSPPSSVMFTCQSKGSSEMKAVITTGSRNFSPASLTAHRCYLIRRTCGRRRREWRWGCGGGVSISSKRRRMGEGKEIRQFGVTTVNAEVDGSRIVPRVSQVRQRGGY